MIAAGKRPIRTWIFRCLIGSAAVLALSGCGINAIPTYEEQMKASWSQVLDQYQRRTDLISALVETAEGFAVQETHMLTSAVKAGDKARQARVPREIISNPAAFQSFQESQAQVTGALARLLGIVENYPMLRSSQSFVSLQSQLDDAEKRIAAARRDYVEAVRLYNAELMTIPGRWWAALLYPDAELAQTFAVEEKDLNAPQVKLAPGTALVLENAAPVEQQ
jgi:LemA protein